MIRNLIPKKKKRKFKSFYTRYKKKYIDTFLSYSYSDLIEGLKNLGIKKGDALMVHSSFSFFNGFQGKPQDVIKAFQECIGEKGTLLMVSMSYDGSTQEYLKATDKFDSKKTMSKMGFLTEVYRRNKKVLRSQSPSHPVLVSGPLAEWFVSDHEKCLYSCGQGTPFSKLLERKGKVLFFDVPFNTFTFIHHIEHLLEKWLPFNLYDDEILEMLVVDNDGCEKKVLCKYFSYETVKRRRPKKLRDELAQSGLLRSQKIGNTHLTLVKVEDAVDCAFEMAKEGRYFYD